MFMLFIWYIEIKLFMSIRQRKIVHFSVKSKCFYHITKNLINSLRKLWYSNWSVNENITWCIYHESYVISWITTIFDINIYFPILMSLDWQIKKVCYEFLSKAPSWTENGKYFLTWFKRYWSMYSQLLK